MRSSCREDIVKRWDVLHDAISSVLELSYDVLTTPECLALLERHELENRRLPQPGHALVNQVARQSDQTELGGKLAHALANRLRISRGEASRRIREAEDLGNTDVRRLTEGYPTGALAEYAVPGTWAGLSAGGAHLKRFLSPRDLPELAS